MPPCRCGHTAEQHTHYRPGTDCGTCGPRRCPTYRPATENTVWSWLRAHLLGDVMAELASLKSIALSTRTALLENPTMAADRELLTTIHAALTALSGPLDALVADRDSWRNRALTAEGAAATDEADDAAAAKPIQDAVAALSDKLAPVAAPAPAPAVEDVPGVVNDAPDPADGDQPA